MQFDHDPAARPARAIAFDGLLKGDIRIGAVVEAAVSDGIRQA